MRHEDDGFLQEPKSRHFQDQHLVVFVVSSWYVLLLSGDDLQFFHHYFYTWQPWLHSLSLLSLGSSFSGSNPFPMSSKSLQFLALNVELTVSS